MSLESGLVPPKFKQATIIPIYKSGPESNYSNYRPISLLPCLSKVMERVVYKQVNEFLERNEVLSRNQYGFRKKHQIQHAILKLLCNITENKEKLMDTIAIFLDIQKAFDTVSHDILLRKLEFYKFDKKSIKWFKSFLEDRTQCVKINSTRSRYRNVKIGVPQGSVLGPLLFLIYINDLDIAANFENIYFADDTVMTLGNDNSSELYEIANRELEKVSNWFLSNRLALHPGKTRYIYFNPPRKYKENEPMKLILNKTHLIRVGEHYPEKSFKYVGVYLDENLKFQDHLNKVHQKVTQNSHILYSNRYSIPKSMRITLYHALIEPYFRYCLAIWGGASKSLMQKLVDLQKKIVRFINLKRYNSHTEDLFKTNNILPIDTVYLKCNTKILDSILDKNSTGSFDVFFKDKSDRTRNKNVFKLPNVNTESLRNIPPYSMIKNWNMINKGGNECLIHNESKYLN